MAGGPVQIVMNPDWFRGDRRSRRGGGAGKDFYRGDDRGFAEHKAAIAGALRSILRSRFDHDRINIAVRMRPDALAKSHRPFGTLFPPSRASHVGTGDYGELVFAVTPVQLNEVIGIVHGAEVEERWREDARGELVYSPSSARTEVSAIRDVRQWAPAEERGYTLEEAEAWLMSDTPTKAQVELFDLPGDPLRPVAIAEISALVSRAHEVRSLFSIAAPPTIESSIRRALNAAAADTPDLPFRESTTATFRNALAEFEASSSVKRVRLQDQILPTSDEPTPRSEPEAPAPAASPTVSRPVVGVIDGGIGGPFINSDWIAGRSNFLAPGDRDINRVTHGTTIASLITLGSAIKPGSSLIRRRLPSLRLRFAACTKFLQQLLRISRGLPR